MIHIIGAGGTGSMLAPLVARHITASKSNECLAIYDPDILEDRNLCRQAFRSADTGYKATLLFSRIAEECAGLLGTSITTVFDRHTADTYMDEGDTVFLCVDNYPTRRIVNDRALQLDNIIVINGGNELTTGSTQVFARAGGVNLTPPLTFLHDEIAGNTVVIPDEHCLDPNRPGDSDQTLAANALSAAFMFAAWANLDRGRKYSEVQWDVYGDAVGYVYDQIPGWQ